jgi:glycosyltransferase involved in cell wall biosynthesis
MPGLDIRIIPNGIDTEKFHPSKKQSFTKPIQALTVGRLISRKRIDLLIEALACAKELGLDIHLNIAGQGNLMARLRRLASKLNLADEVSFMGRIPPERMPQLYRDNDIFVMSSDHEGMSNAMLEAMASGLPIITTRCEGVEELIADNGIIVENPGKTDIAAAIKLLTQDRKTYKSFSDVSRKRAAMFNWSSMATQYIEHYKKIIENKKNC